MSQGTATGTAASVEMLAAAPTGNRDRVTIMLTDATASAYFGFNTAAVAGEGVGLLRVGDTVIVEDELARSQINIIGDGAVVSYQTGSVVLVAKGPVVLPTS